MGDLDDLNGCDKCKRWGSPGWLQIWMPEGDGTRSVPWGRHLHLPTDTDCVLTWDGEHPSEVLLPAIRSGMTRCPCNCEPPSHVYDILSRWLDDDVQEAHRLAIDLERDYLLRPAKHDNQPTPRDGAKERFNQQALLARELMIGGSNGVLLYETPHDAHRYGRPPHRDH